LDPLMSYAKVNTSKYNYLIRNVLYIYFDE
jgi:hypothetical protein